MNETNLLRFLPKVDDLLRRPEILRFEKQFSRVLVRNSAQKAVEKLRESTRAGKIKEEKLKQICEGAEIVERVEKEIQDFENQRVLRAVNATGVVLHTGLGRAALSTSSAAAAQDASGYCLLELDRRSGERGLRDLGIESLLRLLFDCEAAGAVNNNAAATLLAVNSFAKGKEVIVSRGELVEIGGSYRMPEVMKAGGAKLVEVGTTNRTRIEDYREAITKKTGLLLKVHSSNFRIEGFSEATSLEDLVALGREKQIPVVHDLGSGLLLEQKLPGLESEPRVSQSLKAGVDLVTFSGDKLLGGPQSGILMGKKEALTKIRKNPLYRAMRLGKQTLAALESTLGIYLKGEAQALQEIPTLRMLTLSKEEIDRRAESLARGILSLKLEGLDVAVKEDFSQVGSGSAPGVKIPTRVVSLTHAKLKPEKLSTKLRFSNPPVFARIQDGAVLLDPRTLLEGDESFIIAALHQLQEKSRN